MWIRMTAGNGAAGRRPRRMRPNRAGLNLVEVLVATGIAVTGLVSIAAMIPIGMHQLGSAIRADRGSAVAHQAWQDVKVRNVLNFVNDNGVTLLAEVDNTGVAPTVVTDNLPLSLPTGTATAARIVDRTNYTNCTGAFVIDPWAIGAALLPAINNTNTSTLRFFPCRAPSSAELLPRLTIRNADGFRMNAARAMQMFTSQDDPLFHTNSLERLGRAERLTVNPQENSRDLSTAQAGLYTWMLTVSPVLETVGAALDGSGRPFRPAYDSAYFDRRIGLDTALYHVSVAVFFRRPLPRPGNVQAFDDTEECFGTVKFLIPPAGSGEPFSSIAGGEAELQYQGAGLANRSALDLPKPAVGDWLLIYRTVDVNRFDRATVYAGANSPPPPPRVARWYRVEAADDLIDTTGGAFKLRVTLKGPDWDTALFAGNDTANFVLPKRVVNVVERTVQLGR